MDSREADINKVVLRHVGWIIEEAQEAKTAIERGDGLTCHSLLCEIQEDINSARRQLGYWAGHRIWRLTENVKETT